MSNLRTIAESIAGMVEGAGPNFRSVETEIADWVRATHVEDHLLHRDPEFGGVVRMIKYAMLAQYWRDRDRKERT
jgi:hypothetical protein